MLEWIPKEWRKKNTAIENIIDLIFFSRVKLIILLTCIIYLSSNNLVIKKDKKKFN